MLYFCYNYVILIFIRAIYCSLIYRLETYNYNRFILCVRSQTFTLDDRQYLSDNRATITNLLSRSTFQKDFIIENKKISMTEL